MTIGLPTIHSNQFQNENYYQGKITIRKITIRKITEILVTIQDYNQENYHQVSPPMLKFIQAFCILKLFTIIFKKHEVLMLSYILDSYLHPHAWYVFIVQWCFLELNFHRVRVSLGFQIKSFYIEFRNLLFCRV